MLYYRTLVTLIVVLINLDESIFTVDTLICSYFNFFGINLYMVTSVFVFLIWVKFRPGYQYRHMYLYILL